MSCESCKEALEIDGVEPDCFDGECRIPPPDSKGQRILEIRQKLISLHELVDAGTILKMYDANFEDIELLAAMEEELGKLKEEEETKSSKEGH